MDILNGYPLSSAQLINRQKPDSNNTAAFLYQMERERKWRFVSSKICHQLGRRRVVRECELALSRVHCV